MFNSEQRITNLSVKTQIFVMGRHLKDRRPHLCSLGHRGLVDGGGEKRDVVVDIWGTNEEIQDETENDYISDSKASLNVHVCVKI